MRSALEHMSLRFSVGAEKIYQLGNEIGDRYHLIRLLDSQLQDFLETDVIRQLYQIFDVFDGDTIDL